MRSALQLVRPDLGSMLTALAAGEGSASHAWLHSAELNAGPDATRNIADLLHLMTMLHGTQQNVIDIVAEHNIWPGGDAWLAEAARGFATERTYLAALVVAAGPVPGTPGEAATVTAVIAQRAALATIARSDRFGCAIGSVAGLLLDWMPIRAALETAAARIGIAYGRSALPLEESIADMLASLPDQPRLERTVAFGARQVVLHHHGLLDLLAARAGAREG